jgi:hypothetical protein
MLKTSNNNRKEELRQLWGGGQVPPLNLEQTELSLKLWQKIKKRKQREQQLMSQEGQLES